MRARAYHRERSATNSARKTSYASVPSCRRRCAKCGGPFADLSTPLCDGCRDRKPSAVCVFGQKIPALRVDGERLEILISPIGRCVSGLIERATSDGAFKCLACGAEVDKGVAGATVWVEQDSSLWGVLCHPCALRLRADNDAEIRRALSRRRRAVTRYRPVRLRQTYGRRTRRIA
jgi:hypothetical protein